MKILVPLLIGMACGLVFPTLATAMFFSILLTFLYLILSK